MCSGADMTGCGLCHLHLHCLNRGGMNDRDQARTMRPHEAPARGRCCQLLSSLSFSDSFRFSVLQFSWKCCKQQKGDAVCTKPPTPA